MPITYDEGLRQFRTNDWVADLGGMPSRIVWTKHGTVGGGVDGEILVWTRLAGGGEQSVGGVAGSGAAPRASELRPGRCYCLTSRKRQQQAADGFQVRRIVAEPPAQARPQPVTATERHEARKGF